MNKRLPFEASSSLAKRARVRVLRGCLVGWLALGMGCEAKPKTQAAPARSADAGSPQSQGDAASQPGVIVQAGPIKVTLDDFKYALRVNRLVMPMENLEAPREYLSTRRSQMIILENLISDAVVAHELAQRGLTLSDEDRAAGLRTEPALARFAPIFEPPSPAAEQALQELEQRGLERRDIEAVAEIIAGELKLRDALLDATSEEALWAYYASQHDRARVLAFSMTNAPTMGELMNVVESQPEQIEAYFDKHKSRWRRDGVDAELDDALRRQIAGILLAQEAVIPSVRNKMMALIDILRDAGELPAAGPSEAAKAAHTRRVDALKKKLQAQGAEVFTPPIFSRNPQGFIPQIGLAEPLARAIFASDMDQPLSPKPILSRQKAWGFLLLQREHPSREAFEAHKEETRAQYRAAREDSIVDAYVQSYFGAQNPAIDFEPLIKTYGPDTSRAARKSAPQAGAPKDAVQQNAAQQNAAPRAKEDKKEDKE